MHVARTLFLCTLFTTSVQTLAKDLIINSDPTIESFYPEIAKLVIDAYELAGHNVSKIVVPGGRAFILFQSGETDVELMRLEGFDDLAPGAIAVPVALVELTMVAVFDKKSNFKTVADLEHKIAAIERGTLVQEMAVKDLNPRLAKLDGIEATVQMVSLGRADYTVLPIEIAQQFLAKNRRLTILDEPLATVRFYNWVSTENADIVEGVENALLTLKVQGRF